MTDEEQTREQIEEIVNNNNEEPVIIEEIKEEIKEEVKPKAKARPSRAKAKQVKIVKEPVVEPVEENPVVVEEKPEPKVDKLKTIVQCPDCMLSMTSHTLKYIHKRRGFCKAVKSEEVPEPEQAPVAQSKPKLTQDVVNDYIKENPDIVSNYLRNERAMKAQRKQMNARSLLNNAF